MKCKSSLKLTRRRRRSRRRGCGARALLCLKEKIDVLQGFHRVTRGDIVLVEKSVRDVARGPDAGRTVRERGALIFRIDGDAAVLVELDDVF